MTDFCGSFQEITPHGKSKIPEETKKELLQRIRLFLSEQQQPKQQQQQQSQDDGHEDEKELWVKGFDSSSRSNSIIDFRKFQRNDRDNNNDNDNENGNDNNSDSDNHNDNDNEKKGFCMQIESEIASQQQR